MQTNNKDRGNKMKINITAIGKFEYLNNGDEKIDLEIDLLELHNSDFTLNQVITEKFEDLNEEGCSCSFNEGNNHCDCEGYGYAN